MRVGILGCGSPARYAIVDAASHLPEVTVAAAASRTLERAKNFAVAHGIAKYYDSYQDLIEDPDVDLVYIGVPTRLHCHWTLRALQARKHVLCEKPAARNVHEAAQMAEAAERSGVAVIEGFHYRYHPVTRRVCELIGSGAIGTLQTIKTYFRVPVGITPPGHSRLRYDHAGGALLDPGCYCVNLIGLLAGEEPNQVSSEAHLSEPNVDVSIRATLKFPSGCVASFDSSLDSPSESVMASLTVAGDKGTIYVPHPYAPHSGPSISVLCNGVERQEQFDSTMTFVYQLRAIAGILNGETSFKTTPWEIVSNMKVISRIYEAAGLSER